MLKSEQEVEYLLKWQPEKCQSALDLGCGDKKLAPDFIGIDRVKGEVARASGSTYFSTPDILCDITNLNNFVMDNSMDYIVAMHTLEHLCDPVGSLNHWIDKLKIGGRIGIIVPDYRYTWSCNTEEQRFSEDGHKHDFTPEELERIFLVIENLTSKIKILDVSTPTEKYSIGGVIERIL